MREMIVKISLVLLGGLGMFSPTQAAMACKYCDQAAAKATAAAPSQVAPAGTQVQSPGGLTPNGQPPMENSASKGGVIANKAVSSSAGNLISGYLDSVGRRETTSAQPSPEPAAVYVPNSAVYDESSSSGESAIESTPVEYNEGAD